MSALETITLEVRGQVALVRLNRPERLNAWTVQMAGELFTTLARLDRDDGVRAIVVTGEGRAFCAGADLAEGASTFDGEGKWRVAREAEAAVAPWNRRTPIIAALNGPAVGIGATLPLQWDFRLASSAARVGFVFTRRGIIPEAASTWILPRLVGLAAATELLLTGRIVPADEALRLGLVSRVLEPEALLPAALELGREIAANTAPVSVAITRCLLWRQLAEGDPVRAKAHEDALFEWAGGQPDAAEGVESFLEKRAPAWRMSLDAWPADLLPEWGE